MGGSGGINGCRDCMAERLHCHGTLIEHWGQRPDCTEPDCSSPEVLLHALTIDCEAIGCGCATSAMHRRAG